MSKRTRAGVTVGSLGTVLVLGFASFRVPVLQGSANSSKAKEVSRDCAWTHLCSIGVIIDGTPHSVEGIWFRGPTKDDDLLFLSAFPELKRVGFRSYNYGIPPTSVGLGYAGQDITDDGLEYLKTMLNLESVYLDGTKVTDDGVMKLRDLPKLKKIDVTQTNCNPAAMEQLAREMSCTIECPEQPTENPTPP